MISVKEMNELGLPNHPKVMPLAMKTVNRNFDMNIQRYVVVNIHGLADVIDSLLR